MSKIRFHREIVSQAPQGDVDELVRLWQNCSSFRDIVKQVLTNELERSIIKAESEGIYDSPNALATLADLSGYRRGIRFAISLLTSQESQ